MKELQYSKAAVAEKKEPRDGEGNNWKTCVLKLGEEDLRASPSAGQMWAGDRWR